MPLALALFAGLLGGLWLRSEADTGDTGPLQAVTTVTKWAVIGGAVYVAGKALRVL